MDARRRRTTTARCSTSSCSAPGRQHPRIERCRRRHEQGRHRRTPPARSSGRSSAPCSAAARRPTPGRRAPSALIDNWVRARSAHARHPARRADSVRRRGRCLNAAWPHIFDAVMRPRLGNLLERIRGPPRARPLVRRQGPEDGARAPCPRAVLGSLLRPRQHAPPARARCGWRSRPGEPTWSSSTAANESAWRVDQGLTGFIPASSRRPSRPPTGRPTSRSSRWRRGRKRSTRVAVTRRVLPFFHLVLALRAGVRGGTPRRATACNRETAPELVAGAGVECRVRTRAGDTTRRSVASLCRQQAGRGRAPLH